MYTQTEQNWMVFETQAEAEAASVQIGTNIGDSYWLAPVQRLDGKWCFPEPYVDFAAGVVGHTREYYSDTWFA